MDRDTELTLVAGLRAGDTAAFDVIYDALNARLFTFLLRLSRRRDVADDLLEETWLRLVQHASRLKPDTRLAPWLFTVARNLHISYVRSRVLEDSASVSLLSVWPYPAAPTSPFEAAAAGELERRLEHALAALPGQAREVLLLIAAGLSHAEAAGVCGVTAEAFRQRLSRARSALARALDARTVPAPASVFGEVLP